MKDFFYPTSVVVIGVSENRHNMGRYIVQNLISLGFNGEVHAVGPRGGVVMGRPIRQSVKDITFPMDLAVILTPAATVPGLVRECGEAGIRRIVIESAGFSELSDDQKPLEKELLEAAATFDIRFIGPNCIGIFNTENGLATPFLQLSGKLERGNVSVVAQSGGVAKSYMDFLSFEGVYVNKVTSIGNKLNVDEADLLDYLVNEDPGTKIICMYLEGFKNAPRLMEIARNSTKPIIVHKAGVGRAGAESAASHTAALSTDDKVVDAAFRQVGIIRVRSMAEMIDFVKILELPPLKGPNLAIVSRSGGHGVIAADTAEQIGFHIPPFPPEELEEIGKHVRGGVIKLRNPLDLGDLFDITVFEYIARKVLSSENIDGMIMVHGYAETNKKSSRQFIQRVKELGEQHQKPVALCLLVDDREIAYLKQNMDIPIFKSPDDGARALRISYRTHLYRQRHEKFIPHTRAVENRSARRILNRAVEQGRNPTQADCFDILKVYDIPVPAYGTARTAEEAAAAATKIGLPVVLKVDVPSVIHKSDVGGVILNLDSPEAVSEAFSKMEKQLSAHLPSSETFAALIMQQANLDGQEVIFGAKHDLTFGPTLLFGLGGIFAEVLADVSLRVAPVSRNDILEMIREIKGYPILAGVRGKAPRDIESLVDNLLNLAQLAQDFPQIKEIDLNPVISYAEGCLVLDARFIL
jgi:acetate---CoA ligase (ADP-forming)